MNEWKSVRLGDVCEIQSGGTPSRSKTEYWKNGTIPWVKIGDFSGKYLNKTTEHITQKGLENSSAKLFSKGTILYSIFATLGEATILNIDATTNQAIAGIKIKDKSSIDIDYLFAYLKSLKEEVNRIGRGVAQNNINLSILKSFTVPLPPLETQKQIAKQLNKCTTLLEKHKQMLEKYDTLIKSRFIEMFGDNKYPIISISEMVEGKVPSAKKLFNKTDEIKYIDISSVDNKINEIVGYTEYIFEEAPSRAQQHIRKNDILISTVRPNLKNIAINRLDYKEMVASSGFCVLRPKCVPEYLFVAVLQDKFTSDMVAVTTGANYPAIKDSDVLNYEISNPPLELQQQFAAFVQQIDKSKFVVQKSLEKAETLYKSLMQEYFG